MDYKLLKIDKLTVGLHSRLKLEVDSCFYLMEYCSGENFSFSKDNDYILNFKKSMAKWDLPEFPWKYWAVREIAKFFKPHFTPAVLKRWTLVPIPPSKSRSHDLYDDRMTRLLQIICQGVESDFREIIYMQNDMESSHETNCRPSVEQIYQNLRIDENFKNPAPSRIILFDDVLTAGTHFKACKRILQETYPNVEEIRGVFVARRIFPPPEVNQNEDEYW